MDFDRVKIERGWILIVYLYNTTVNVKLNDKLVAAFSKCYYFLYSY